MVLIAILGLLLTLFLMILFVPIRYRVNAEKQQDFQCQIRVSWFLRGIEWRGNYTGKGFLYHLKILGITIKSNLSEKKKEDAKEKKRINRKDKKKKEQEKEQDSKKVLSQENKITIEKSSSETEKLHKTEEMQKAEDLDKTKDIHEIEDLDKTKDIRETEDLNKTEDIHETEEQNKTADTGETEKLDKIEEDKTEKADTFFEKIQMTLSEKSKRFCSKIKRIKKKIKNMLINIRNSISKLKLIWSFLTEEENKTGFKACLEAFKKLVKHIKPNVLKGYLKFGTNDPCTTGQILGLIAVFYGSYGICFEIKPDFEEAVLECSDDAKGKIRIFTVGKIVIKLWFSKELKILIENFKNCKEELENGR